MKHKLTRKLMQLNIYLRDEIKDVSERKEFWEQRLEEKGDIVIDARNETFENTTYGDMVKSQIDRITQYEKEIEENNKLIRELGEM